MANNQFAFMNINILVVDDDPTSLAIVSAMLKTWKHQVVTSMSPMDALSTLREQGGIDLVVSDLHMPNMNGFELQEIIQLEFELPVIIMSSDDKESVILESMARGAALYLPKPVKPNDLKNIWQYVLKAKKVKLPTILEPIGGGSKVNQESRGSITDENEKLTNNEVLKTGSSSLIKVDMRGNKKRKPYERRMKELLDLEFDNQAHIVTAPKKTKIVWTSSLHTKFVQAMHKIGFQKAVPKTILEVMNVPGLTRENVASHLQKYRLYLKSLTNKPDSSKGIIEGALKSNFNINGDSLLFRTHNQSQHQNPTTNLSSTNSFTEQRYPKIMNQSLTHDLASGLGSYNQSNSLTSHPLLFGRNGQSVIHGNMNNSSDLNNFGTNFSINANNEVAYGGIPNGVISTPIYQQHQTQLQTSGPFGIAGYSPTYEVDGISGGEHIPIANVNNNYGTPKSSNFIDNINNYVDAGNVIGGTTKHFQFYNENDPSYDGYDMNRNNYCNQNNVNFVTTEGYNMVQGAPCSGIWNENVNNYLGFENIVRQPPHLPTIMQERFGLAYDTSTVDHNNLLYDSIYQVPNQPSVNQVTNIEQFLADPYEPTLNQRSEMLTPNLGNGGGGDGNEENTLDSIVGDVPLMFDDNYSKYDPTSNYQEQSIGGDIFNGKINNHYASGNQATNNVNWTYDDLATFTGLE
ncbi:hypothetical protein ACFE04_028991 [Oxalis oulophora]